jgi:hypothetical protein
VSRLARGFITFLRHRVHFALGGDMVFEAASPGRQGALRFATNAVLTAVF